ncbi:MAG: hypothetical protein WBA23_17135 [Tunicatimonas sp.]|uniref:hypothetical protein n=1 Tax=Tunicatimonas sp. TaxID=1940096 RepID=UPI003C76ABC3
MASFITLLVIGFLELLGFQILYLLGRSVGWLFRTPFSKSGKSRSPSEQRNIDMIIGYSIVIGLLICFAVL